VSVADAAVDAEALAAEALRWLIGMARESGGGLGWPEAVGSKEIDACLYGGTAGVVVTMLEAHRHFADDSYADLAVRGARSLTAGLDEVEDCSLYFGLTGIAVALRSVETRLGLDAFAPAVDQALGHVRSRFDGERWAPEFELLAGNAGIALGGLAVGDLELAVLAVEPYRRTAQPTRGGVQWEVRAELAARLHHISHGTLGIAYALAAVGAAAGRADFIELALAGAADVVSRNEAGPGDFLVAHSDPLFEGDGVERYSYGWCHGPAGDAQVFRLLGTVTGDPVWRELADRCWHTVTSSGLPRRTRPGFWDNNGRCCGTAGVLALACDRCVEQDGDLDFATGLLWDLAARATADRDGVRWSNHEHRVTPSALAPHTGWAQGNAGIIRELLRFARLSAGMNSTYAVDWPDQPAADPFQA
jgi:Lanthionine synthetase C-like protein